MDGEIERWSMKCERVSGTEAMNLIYHRVANLQNGCNGYGKMLDRRFEIYKRFIEIGNRLREFEDTVAQVVKKLPIEIAVLIVDTFADENVWRRLHTLAVVTPIGCSFVSCGLPWHDIELGCDGCMETTWNIFYTSHRVGFRYENVDVHQRCRIAAGLWKVVFQMMEGRQLEDEGWVKKRKAIMMK